MPDAEAGMIVVRSASGHLLWVAETADAARDRPEDVNEWGRVQGAKLWRVVRRQANGGWYLQKPIKRPDD